MSILGGLDGGQQAHDLIEQQEAEISQKAGLPSLAIQRLNRAAITEPTLVRAGFAAPTTRQRTAAPSDQQVPIASPAASYGRTVHK